MAALFLIDAFAISFALIMAAVFGVGEALNIAARKKRLKAKAKASSELYELLPLTDFSNIVAHFAEKRNRLEIECLEGLLLDMLEGHKPFGKKRWQAALAIKLHMPSQIPWLLLRPSAESVSFGARKAGLYKTEKALPLLLQALHKSITGASQLDILVAISRIGDTQAFLSALKSLEGKCLFSRYALDEVFNDFDGDREEALHEILTWDRSEFIVPALRGVTKETAYALSSAIAGFVESEDKEVRIAALNALGRMPRDAPTDLFRSAIDDSEWQVRSAACRLLGMHIALSCGSLLLHAISDLSWWVRQNAAFSVIPYIEFNEHLLTQFNYKDPYALMALKFALEKAGKRKLLHMLSAFAESASGSKPNNIYYITYKTNDRDQSLTATLIDI